MEILNTYQKSRKLLFVTDCLNKNNELINILSSEYIIEEIEKDAFDISFLSENKWMFSALLLCSSKAEENDFELLKELSINSYYADIPVVVFLENEDSGSLAEYLKSGADDIITYPYCQELILHRMKRTIKFADFSTFYEIENILRELPSNIYMKDREGKYIFATHYWHHLDHKNNPNWTIRGKTDLEIRKDKENAIKAMESDIEIIKSGKGTSYTIEINTDGKQEFFDVIKQPFFDENHEVAGIIALLNNVTDRELLRISLEQSVNIDELTQVYNRRFFDEYTANLVKSKTYPFSIISADCNSLKKINDTFGHLAGDEYIRITALLFRMIIGNSGAVFRTGGDEFVIILPDYTLEMSQNIIEKLKESQKLFCIKNVPLSVSYGTCCVSSEEDDFTTCLNQADKLMYEEKQRYKLNRQ